MIEVFSVTISEELWAPSQQIFIAPFFSHIKKKKNDKREKEIEKKEKRKKERKNLEKIYQ